MDNKNDISATASIKFSSNANLEGIIQEVDKGIEVASKIPTDAKIALKDFIHENIKDIIEKISDLANYPVPDSISEWWPIAAEIIEKIIKLWT